jgi:hypothetical protein
MAHRSQHIAFFVEQLQGGWIGDVEDRLDGNFAADDSVVGSIDESHSTLAEDLPHFVAAS